MSSTSDPVRGGHGSSPGHQHLLPLDHCSVESVSRIPRSRADTRTRSQSSQRAAFHEQEGLWEVRCFCKARLLWAMSHSHVNPKALTTVKCFSVHREEMLGLVWKNLKRRPCESDLIMLMGRRQAKASCRAGTWPRARTSANVCGPSVSQSLK